MIAPIQRFEQQNDRSLGAGGRTAIATTTIDGEASVSVMRRFWLRVLFALNAIGAGGCGLLVLAAPERAAEWLFEGNFTPDASSRVLGCIWVALGLVSIAGLLRPVTFCPVLVIQFVYKLTWLLAIATPAFAKGEAIPPALAIIFGGWVIAVGATVPWGYLLSRPRQQAELTNDRVVVSEVTSTYSCPSATRL